ncbi:MAG: hypothetical protein ACWGOV_03050 [Acidiferrobacterales bacterium]
MAGEWWMIIPGNQGASLAIIAVILIVFMYGGRTAMHGALHALTRTVAGPLRLGARWLFITADDMRARNKAVLLAHGREELKRTIEREFERISNVVQRDLHGYPELQRKLMAETTKIEEDYKKCAEVPPTSPQWDEAVQAIANIRPSNGLVEKILEDIASSMEKIHSKAMAEYRTAYQKRHKILKAFAPFWRSLSQTMVEVDKKIEGLQDTAKRIDAQMDRFKEIDKGSDKAEAMLQASASRQFIIDTLLVLLVGFGAYINSRLIAYPLAEMVDNKMVGAGLRTADVASLVIIFIEIVMGVFLMEAMGMTHLFPKMGSLSAKATRRIVWASAMFLLFLSTVEAALAFMRDQMIAQSSAVTESLLHGGEAAAAASSKPSGGIGNLPVAGQMTLGFMLPWALAFIAIPFESFMTSVRTVVGMLLVLLIRSIGFVLRISSNVIKNGVHLLVSLYDVIIFIPLAIERMVRTSTGNERRSQDRSGVASFPKRKAGERTATGEF